MSDDLFYKYNQIYKIMNNGNDFTNYRIQYNQVEINPDDDQLPIARILNFTYVDEIPISVNEMWVCYKYRNNICIIMFMEWLSNLFYLCRHLNIIHLYFILLFPPIGIILNYYYYILTLLRYYSIFLFSIIVFRLVEINKHQRNHMFIFIEFILSCVHIFLFYILILRLYYLKFYLSNLSLEERRMLYNGWKPPPVCNGEPI